MPSLDDLLRRPDIGRAREQGGTTSQPPGRPTGYAALDRCLPGGGWPTQGLIEILADRHGIGELSLLMPALAAASRDEHGEGWIAWVAPPHQPYAPALAACGVDVNRLLVVRGQPAEWAMEQALRSGACSAVLGWAGFRDRYALRRLQLAAEQSRSLAVLFRKSGDACEPSPAVLRVVLESGREGLAVRIVKSRGGRVTTVRLGRLDPAALAAAH
jgi:hypothetical protein